VPQAVRRPDQLIDGPVEVTATRHAPQEGREPYLPPPDRGGGRLAMHDEVELPDATNFSLVITNVQMTHAGPYTAAASDANGTTVSDTALLEVDPTFQDHCRRDRHGPTPLARSGLGTTTTTATLDLFLVTTESNWNPIYRNNGDGTFTRIIEPSLQGCTTTSIVSNGRTTTTTNPDLFLPDQSA
jgi:hypothetical protein